MRSRNLLLFLLLAALWGPSFLFIKIAVADIPPISLAFGRAAVGGAFLLLVLLLQRKRLPRDRTVWRDLAVIALIHNALPNVLFNWGEQTVDSALASIVNGTTPLFTIILAHFFVAGDRLTPAKIVGVLLGFSGLVLLILPSFSDGLGGSTIGMLALIAAAASYGAAIVYSRNHLRGLPSLVAPASQLTLAALYTLPLVLVVDRPWTLPAPSPAAAASLLALGFFGTGLAFLVYYRLLETAEPSYLSMVTYVIPVFGVILGVLVLDERLTWSALVGFGLILLGVLIVNGVLSVRRPAAAALPEKPR